MNNPKPTNGGKLQHSLERGADSATAAAHEAIDSAADATGPALEKMVENAHGAVERVGGAASTAAGALGNRGDQLADGSKRAVQATGGFVREHPLASLSLAAAAGFLLSRVVSSR